MGKSIQFLILIAFAFGATIEARADLLINPNSPPGTQTPNTPYNQAWNSYQNYLDTTGMPAGGASVPGGPYLPDGSPNPQYAKPWELSNPFYTNFYSGPGSPGFGFMATAPLNGYNGPGPGYGAYGNFGVSAGIGGPSAHVGHVHGVGCGPTPGAGCNGGVPSRCFGVAGNGFGGGSCGGRGGFSGFGSSGYSSGGSSVSFSGGSFDREFLGRRSGDRSTASTSDSNGSVGNGNSSGNKPVGANADCNKVLDLLLSKLGTDYLQKAFDVATYRVALANYKTTGQGKADGSTKYVKEYLDSELAKLKTAGGDYEKKLPELLAIYKKFGYQETVESLKSLDTSAKGSDGKECVPGNTKMTGMILAKSTDSASGVTQADAAAVWAIEKIRKSMESKDATFKVDGANGKNLSIAYRVHNLMNEKGVDAAGKKIGRSKIEKNLDLKKMALSDALKTALAAALTEKNPAIVACKKYLAGCKDCQEKYGIDGDGAVLNADALNSAILKLKLDKITSNKISDTFNNLGLDLKSAGNKTICE